MIPWLSIFMRVHATLQCMWQVFNMPSFQKRAKARTTPPTVHDSGIANVSAKTPVSSGTNMTGDVPFTVPSIDSVPVSSSTNMTGDVPSTMPSTDNVPVSSGTNMTGDVPSTMPSTDDVPVSSGTNMTGDVPFTMPSTDNVPGASKSTSV